MISHFHTNCKCAGKWGFFFTVMLEERLTVLPIKNIPNESKLGIIPIRGLLEQTLFAGKIITQNHFRLCVQIEETALFTTLTEK